MTDLDLPALRRKAEAATPGPWIRSGVRQKLRDTDCDCIMVGPDSFLIAGLPIGRDHAGAFRDAAHIAAFDPPTALALITSAERLAEARTVIERIKHRADTGGARLETAADACDDISHDCYAFLANASPTQSQDVVGKIVAWLRQPNTDPRSPCWRFGIGANQADNLADAIETGDFRPKEKPDA